jgi:starvation-inducible outer membrane lipoprotein
MRKSLLVIAFSIVVGCTYPDPTGYKVFGIEKLREIKQNPQRYAGKLYAFAGRAVDVEKTESQTVFRILVQSGASSEADNAADNSLFVVYPSGKTTVIDGHHVKVLGYIREPSIGKSLFGTKVTSLTLNAVAVYDTFTGYPFRLSRDEELFRKWKTGEPLGSD